MFAQRRETICARLPASTGGQGSIPACLEEATPVPRDICDCGCSVDARFRICRRSTETSLSHVAPNSMWHDKEKPANLHQIIGMANELARHAKSDYFLACSRWIVTRARLGIKDLQADE